MLHAIQPSCIGGLVACSIYNSMVEHGTREGMLPCYYIEIGHINSVTTVFSRDHGI